MYILLEAMKHQINGNDFCEFYWLSIDEFFKRLENGDRAKSDLPIIINEIKGRL